MLGALFVSQFWSNVHDGNYTESGYRRLIERYLDTASAPGWWERVERAVADHAAVLSVVQATGELTLGVALAAGVLRAPAAVGGAAFLAALWLSELGRYWPWELVAPFVAAVAVAVSARGSGLLGARITRPALGVVVVPLGALVVAGILLANQEPDVVAWRSAAVVGAALAGSSVLDARFRTGRR
jgi:uncharacterized membrane protein YphA (DoxX/SURF4 family)